MLHFPEPLVDDQTANKLISRHICRMLRDAIDHSISISILDATDSQCSTPWYQCITENPDILSNDSFSDLFPIGMTAEERFRVTAGLYSLLLSPYQHTPTIRMEYLLARSISFLITANEEAIRRGVNQLFHLPFSKSFTDPKEMQIIRSAIVHRVAREKYELGESTDLTATQLDAMSEDQLYEMFREDIDARFKSLQVYDDTWLDFCFWDSDYELLDELQDFRDYEKLIDSPVGETLGLEKDDEFIIPEKWWESLDFRWKREQGNGKPLILF